MGEASVRFALVDINDILRDVGVGPFVGTRREGRCGHGLQ